jgi:hypothetical protein
MLHQHRIGSPAVAGLAILHPVHGREIEEPVVAGGAEKEVYRASGPGRS